MIPYEDLTAALPGALERGELEVVFQPQVSLGTDRIVGAEALLRWNRPGGPVSPATFIPVAEVTGDIVAIGSWVLRRACEQAAAWQRSLPGLRPWSISVNVSPRQFDPGLVDVVRAALLETGLAPEALRLEVTETALIEDVRLAGSLLRELRELGVSLSLDDFGTGYSSLTYFRQFVLDEVKIDRAFVAGLGKNAGDTAIVASVVNLSHALERTVVAEGVETVGQLEHLRSLGCDLAQGYLLGRPMSARDLEAMLAHSAAGGRVRPAGDDHREAHLPSVLVVDDSPVVRQLARMCLTAAGFSVSESGTGADGLALAASSRPDCVLLDMHLPDMIGHEVCAALRESPATAGCAVVMLTAVDTSMTKAEAFRAGADDYIVKPFVPRDLAARVQSALRRREAA